MMPHTSKRGVRLLPVLVLAFFSVIIGLHADARARVIIPDNLTIQPSYRHGVGQSVGTVKVAQGKAFIMHSDRQNGYTAQKGLPLYNRDTLFTRDGGRMVVSLKDGSEMTLAPDSSLMINKSVYDPKGKNRLSFMEMFSGKARFLVKKLAEYKYSRFNVKTSSSVVGVRGSDFIVERMGDDSQVTALQDTTLEVSSLDFPDAPPVIIRDFQQLGMRTGQPLGQPLNVPKDQIQKIMQGVDNADDTGDTGDDAVGDQSGQGDESGDEGDSGDTGDSTGDDTGDDTGGLQQTPPDEYVPEDGPPPEDPTVELIYETPAPEAPLPSPEPAPIPEDETVDDETEAIIQEATELPAMPAHP
ncbi:MAG: FecR family protein [Thermodesulfobacteriota bacterium]|nr:FecR family protein [Thermodesulfobacteriota bacterium]